MKSPKSNFVPPELLGISIEIEPLTVRTESVNLSVSDLLSVIVNPVDRPNRHRRVVYDREAACLKFSGSMFQFDFDGCKGNVISAEMLKWKGGLLDGKDLRQILPLQSVSLLIGLD